MEDFVSFDLAKKLSKKGFTCKYPFAMYFRNRMYYDYDDFIGDKDAIIAPTISQVLKWLREEKFILIGLSPMQEYDGNEIIEWCSTIYKADKHGGMSWIEEFYYESYEQAALAGIEYVLNNLI
jgi:hypothetical protein